MGIHSFTKNTTEKIKLPSKKERLKKYREIYVLLRQLKLSHKLAEIKLLYILVDMNQRYEVHDSITEVDTSWYRCQECNKILRIDKPNDTRFCSSRSCSLYHIHIDKKGKRYVQNDN